MSMKIKENDRLVEVFKKYPIIRNVYLRNGFHCVGCEINEFETVVESLVHHDVEDTSEFITYLNSVKDLGSLEEE